MKIIKKGKIRENRGSGDGANYKPYIKTREVNSKGTCSNFIDWKTGRQLQLLSQTELGIYMQLRWDDNVADIKEQYPLEVLELKKILSLRKK